MNERVMMLVSAFLFCESVTVILCFATTTTTTVVVVSVWFAAEEVISFWFLVDQN